VDIKDLRERTRLPVKQLASLITRLLREVPSPMMLEVQVLDILDHRAYDRLFGYRHR